MTLKKKIISEDIDETTLKYINEMVMSRKKCDDRGYHKVEDDKKKTLACYDCNFQFKKDGGVEYKVVPLNP